MQISRSVRIVVAALLIFALTSVGGLALIGDRGDDDGREPSRNGPDAAGGEHAEQAGEVLIDELDGFVLSAEGTGPIDADLQMPGVEMQQPVDPALVEALREAGFLGGFVRTWAHPDQEPGSALASALAYKFSQDAPPTDDVAGPPEGFEQLDVPDVPGVMGFVGDVGDEGVYAQASFTSGEFMFEFSTIAPEREEAETLIRGMVIEQHARIS